MSSEPDMIPISYYWIQYSGMPSDSQAFITDVVPPYSTAYAYRPWPWPTTWVMPRQFSLASIRVAYEVVQDDAWNGIPPDGRFLDLEIWVDPFGVTYKTGGEGGDFSRDISLYNKFLINQVRGNETITFPTAIPIDRFRGDNLTALINHGGYTIGWLNIELGLLVSALPEGYAA
jgi:hypothetical protein